jgi:hypothetical protein
MEANNIQQTMKQKLVNKVKVFQFTFLICFVLAESFGFGGLNKASASSATGDCFNIDGMQAEQGQITKTSTSVFDFKVSRNSSTGDCRTRITPTVIMAIKQSGIFTPDVVLTKANLDFSNLSTPSVTSSISYNWSQLPSTAWSNLPNANTIDYYMRVDYYNGSFADGAFSGATTYDWGKQLDIVISLPGQNPTAGGTPIGQPCQTSSQCVNNLCNASGQCDSCKNYTTDICNTSGGQNYTCNSSGACVGGNVAVGGICSGSGQGNCVANATCTNGTCTANSKSPTTTTKIANGQACNILGDGTDCQSNLCNPDGNGGGVCQACTSTPDTCNTAGFSGYTCTSGVCIKGANATTPNSPAGNTPAAAANSATTLFNPLPEGDLVHVFLLVAQGFLGILGILAVVFIVVGGFEMVVAAGNEEMYLKAKKTIVWAVLGLVVATLSFSIIAIVEDFLGVTIPTATSTTPTPGNSSTPTPGNGSTPTPGN